MNSNGLSKLPQRLQFVLSTMVPYVIKPHPEIVMLDYWDMSSPYLCPIQSRILRVSNECHQHPFLEVYATKGNSPNVIRTKSLRLHPDED